LRLTRSVDHLANHHGKRDQAEPRKGQREQPQKRKREFAVAIQSLLLSAGTMLQGRGGRCGNQSNWVALARWGKCAAVQRRITAPPQPILFLVELKCFAALFECLVDMLEGISAMSAKIAGGTFEILFCLVQVSHRSVDLRVVFLFVLVFEPFSALRFLVIALRRAHSKCK
jgi:hypothetical protein